MNKVHKRSKCNCKAEIWENRTGCETRIKVGTSVAQIKKLKLIKVRQLYGACCVKISEEKDDLVILGYFCTEAYIIYFLAASYNFCLPQH